MAKRNQFRGALGSNNSGQPGRFERIAFRGGAIADRFDGCSRHQYACGSYRSSSSDRLLGGVNHPGPAMFIDVRESIHSKLELTAEAAEAFAEDTESSYRLTTLFMPSRKCRTLKLIISPRRQSASFS